MATRKISTELSLSGEKQFNDQMKAVNSNLKALKAEMNAVSTSFDENASASEKLRSRQSVLNQQIDQQKEKVRALEAMYEKCKDELGENEAKTDKYRTAMLNAQTELNKFEAAQRRLNQELEDAENAARDAERGMDRLEPSLEDAAEESKDLRQELSKTIDKLKDAGPAAEKFGKALGVMGKSYALFGAAGTLASTAIAALGVVGFKTLATYAIEAANSGDPAFASLAENLTELEAASSSAKAALGGILLPALESLSEEGAQLLQGFSDEIEAAAGDTEKIGGIMADYVTKAAQALKRRSGDFMDAAGDLVDGLTDGIIKNEDELKDAVDTITGNLAEQLEENAPQIGQAGAILFSTLVDAAFSNAPGFFSAGTVMIQELLAGLDGEELGAKAFELASFLLQSLVDVAPELFDAGVEFASAVLKGLRDTDWMAVGEEIINLVWSGMQSIWDEIVGWFNDRVSQLHGTAYIDVYTRQYGVSMDETGTKFPGYATGLDYVPYDEYPAILHEGEMVVPKSLASQLRNAGVTRNTERIDRSGGSSNVNVSTDVNVRFEGSLAALARVLHPHIEAESKRRGPTLVK